MNNREIAEIFHSIADILEIRAENPFRIRVYRKAAGDTGTALEINAFPGKI